jgi:hypothetical protein
MQIDALYNVTVNVFGDQKRRKSVKKFKKMGFKSEEICKVS